MLLKDFYQIQIIDKISDTKYVAQILLNENHDVFKGHFPGNPVTPGVCMMQIIKELSQNITGFSLQLKSSSNVKFMALINPEVTPELKLELEITSIEDDVKVKNATSFGETVALKLSNTYKKIIK
ncbi:3-hydroxyacyl-ACP dehydratase [Flavobacterium macacae]|uniref:3-hydroxyacyl-ACP dehydratase n=1 Tax=Flavobacterium macacae TaxID=2488993 RepID=A0A3P3WFW9_9FLAO|nr:3-hydroxyacyl-ACP dehydratase [Flavobacterium macacae]RRJ94000.1 3-hydroxyacyl-ACP dehydratase [Flavobacterium macacae]